ncbi:MAG TPA: class I SAM-dependent methyltransferase [Vicinamibacteria bacterium]
MTPFRTPPEILGGAAEYLAAEPPRRALDLCCGTGAMLEVVRPLAKELTVGLDFSRGMLRVARRTEASLVRADALAPPFDEAFDLVTCFSALGHFLPSEQTTLVRAIRAVLKPGGRFLFATGNLPERTSMSYWSSRAFNAARHVRNAIWSPPFVMYYLTFVLPEARALLENEGFEVRVESGIFRAPFERYCLVEARKKGKNAKAQSKNAKTQRAL